MSADATQAEILVMLRAINRRLDEIPAQIAGIRATTGSLSGVDRAALSAALSQYAAAVPGLDARVFSARDLLADERVRDALHPVVRDVSDAGGPRRVGKLLARASGMVLGELHLTRAGDDREGAIWRIAKVRT